jgi:hypothetical protein
MCTYAYNCVCVCVCVYVWLSMSAASLAAECVLEYVLLEIVLYPRQSISRTLFLSLTPHVRVRKRSSTGERTVEIKNVFVY